MWALSAGLIRWDGAKQTKISRSFHHVLLLLVITPTPNLPLSLSAFPSLMAIPFFFFTWSKTSSMDSHYLTVSTSSFFHNAPRLHHPRKHLPSLSAIVGVRNRFTRQVHPNRSELIVKARRGGGSAEVAAVDGGPQLSRFQVSRGSPVPLGATLRDGGVNFAVFAGNAVKATLCLMSLSDLEQVSCFSCFLLFSPFFFFGQQEEQLRNYAVIYGLRSWYNSVIVFILGFISFWCAWMIRHCQFSAELEEIF